MTATFPDGGPQASEASGATSTAEELTTLTNAPFVVRWGVFDALFGFPFVLAGALGGAYGLSFVLPGAALNAITLLWLQLLMAGWAVSVARRKGNGPRSDFGISLLGLSDFISAVVLGLSLLMIGSVAAGLVSWLLGLSASEQTTNTGIVTNVQGFWRWMMVGLVVIGAPVAEELFFRGLLLGALKRRFGSVVGVLGSTVAFTALHYTGGPLRESVMLFSVIGVIGLVLGSYAVRSGRVLPTIIAHSVFNALVVIASF